ncbi:MAG: DUF4430 domain-containing protein [Mobilitalea sp.]
MNKKSKIFKSALAIGLLVVVAVVMLLVYNQFKPQGTEGSKKVVVEVVIPDKDNADFTLKTDAEFLRQALEEAELVKGSDSEYGLFITEVNGRAVDDTKQEWWCITKNGEDVFTGVDEVAILDGDHYELTLTVGY